MKSKISCCNGPVFRKNLTRFAPLWVLYTLCLLMGMVMLAESGMEYWFTSNLVTCINFMGLVNCCYGLLAALLLFGDLTQPRMCYGLHALPLRRETWFGTNLLSGLFFSLVPTAIMTAAAAGLSCFSSVERGWQIPLYWMLGTNLQFLFCFGLAVFCCFLTGSRMGAGVVYGIVNFSALLAFYLADVIYVPQLPGVVLEFEAFIPLSPVYSFLTLELIDIYRIQEFTHFASDGSRNYLLQGEFTLLGDWWYLWVCAAIGIALLVLALLLYRKRKLECAGDMMATKALEPIFLVLFSLTAGGICQVVYETFLGSGTSAFLWVGLIAGWFAGLMLLRRSSRVFGKKSILGVLVLCAALGLSLVVNAVDPFGIVQWTPKAENVKSVDLRLRNICSINLDDQQAIEDVIDLHAIAAEKQWQGEMRAVNDAVPLDEGDGACIEIHYELKDGRDVSREYMVLVDSEAGDIAKKYFSSLDAVFTRYLSVGDETTTEENPLLKLDVPEEIYLEYVALPEEYLTEDYLRGLVDAILADSRDGNLVQHNAFHPESIYQANSESRAYRCFHLRIDCPENRISLDLYADSEHTVQYLKDTGAWDYVVENLDKQFLG